MKQVTIYSDGACQGNPGPGGWAAVLIYGTQVRRISGGDPATTNNRMELEAALRGLLALKYPCEVSFHTDSKYLRDGITLWVHGWKRRGWRTKEKTPVKNEDLWRALDAESARHKITWNWVKGHSGDRYNEECDQLAVAAIKKIRTQFSSAQLKQELQRFAQSCTSPAPASDLFLPGVTAPTSSK